MSDITFPLTADNVAQVVAERDAEIEQLQNQVMDTKGLLVTAQNLARNIRAATIEECARVAYNYVSIDDADKIAAAIRALKEQP